MLEYVLSAFAALGANKLRSALTMLGVIIGVLAVTLLVGVGEGARNYLEATLSGIGTNLLVINAGRRETKTMGGPPSMVAKPLTLEDMRALERQAFLLRGVSPVLHGNGTIRNGTRRRDTIVLGVGPAFSDLRNMPVAVGSFVRQEDFDGHRRVCILGRTVIRELFGEEQALGASITIADARFRVVGLMAPKGTSIGFDLDDLVFIPATTGLDVFGRENVDNIVTATRTKEDVPAAIAQIEEVLARRRSGEKSFTVQSQEDLLQTFDTLTRAMTLVLMAIASISLVVGGIGIMNIMLVSVRERTREIGVRRALGATQQQILWQFLLESIVISVLGGAVGLGLGVAIVLGVKRAVPDVPITLSPWIAAVACGSALFVGIVSGVVPARRAAKLDPVEALRYE